MALRKTVIGSISWAVMGFALTGAALGQVAAPGIAEPGVVDPGIPDPGTPAPAITDGTIIRDGQIKTDTVTEAPTTAVDAAATAESNVKNNAGVDNPSTDPQDSNATSNLNNFGATFDSNATDRLIIQDLQANSTASRLGLQAGDRIIEFNGQTYTDARQFDRDLAQLNGNADIPVVYERNGMRHTKSFRMSSQNTQQPYGNQGSGNQYDNSEPLSHSAARPMYGTPSNNGYSGGMESHPGYPGGAAAYGNNSHHSQLCCGAPVHARQCGSGHRHGGRRHRRCCR